MHGNVHNSGLFFNYVFGLLLNCKQNTLNISILCDAGIYIKERGKRRRGKEGNRI